MFRFNLCSNLCLSDFHQMQESTLVPKREDWGCEMCQHGLRIVYEAGLLFVANYVTAQLKIELCLTDYDQARTQVVGRHRLCVKVDGV